MTHTAQSHTANALASEIAAAALAQGVSPSDRELVRDSAAQVIDKAIRDDVIVATTPGMPSTFAEIQARYGVTVRPRIVKPGRLPVIRAAVGALILTLGLPLLLWLVGHGLLPLYSWGLSWLR